MRKLICVSAFLLALAEFSVAQNSTLKCETFPGADAGAKMAACIAAMPNGGTADAKALTGSQTITTDVFAGVSKSGTLLLADATYTLTGSSACFNVPSHWTVHGIGEDKSIFQGKGQCQGAIGRTVLTKGSFVTLEYFKVEGTNIAEQCVGLLDGHDDTVRYVWADHCGQYGIVASNRQPPTASTPFTNTRIEHNKVTNYGNSEGFGSIGIEVFPKSADAFEKNERGEWVQIPATSKRLAQEMLAPGIVIASNESIAQPGMIVTGCGLKLNGAQDGLIQNNTVDLSGIRLDKGNQGGICALTSEHVEIVDNRITGGINSISLSGGMDPRNPHRGANLVVRNNQIIDPVENGIYCAYGTDGLVIDGNTIVKNNHNPKYHERGIYLQRTAQTYIEGSPNWTYNGAGITNNQISGFSIAIDANFTSAQSKPEVNGNKTQGRVAINQ